MSVRKKEAMGKEDTLRNIVADISRVAPASIKGGSDLQKDLGIDSFNAVEILVAVEREYGIRIERAEAFGVRTFNDILALVKRYLGGQ